MKKTINELVEIAHNNSVNHGFWEKERNFGEVIALMHTELSEAFEEYRHGRGLNETYYEDTILVKYKYSSSSESRILEDDIITLYGKSMGTYTYESVLGSPITVPYIDAMYIDIKSK